jgi:hypothetical protein
MNDKNFSWYDKALCKDIPLDNFFIDKINAKNKSLVSSVYSLCDSCPVASHCLHDALVNDDDGIRAGTNYHHRTHLYEHYLQKSRSNITLFEASNCLYAARSQPISLRMRIGRNFFKRGTSHDLL